MRRGCHSLAAPWDGPPPVAQSASFSTSATEPPSVLMSAFSAVIVGPNHPRRLAEASPQAHSIRHRAPFVSQLKSA